MDETVVVPYCYKIKESCIPCHSQSSSMDCIKELSKLVKHSQPHISQIIKEKDVNNLFNCLKKYGDIYKKLGIELYVNPTTKQILFPDNQRIQSNFNLYLENIDVDTDSPKINNIQEDNIILYNILLNDKLRKMYNDFYYSYGFSESGSLEPKEYGISKILGNSSGGKKTRKHKKKSKKSKKCKKRKTCKR
jgi:hypothetical protein